MSSSGNIIALRSANQERESAFVATEEEISEAISRAQQNLLRQQHEDGHWCGELLVDSTLCSDFVLFMHWLGEVDFNLQERSARHILKRQLPDGGWNIYFGGPSEINASIKGYFALKLAGYSPDLPFMRKARENILRLGGIPRMNTFSKLYLALLGQFPWKYLPTIPVEMILLPTWAPFHIYKMSSWSRAMLIPLAIINHFKPTRTLAGDKQLHELYPIGTEQSDLRLPRSEKFWTWRNFFLRVTDVLKILHPFQIRSMRKRALEEAERWMLERIGEGSDGLAAVYPAMLNCMIALRVLGYPKDHPIYKKAAKDFAGLFVDDPEDFRIQPCLSPIWDTAINLIALAESGLPADDPALRKAAKWLLDKEVRIKGDWTNNNSHPEASGWAFEYNNVYYPDVDDTAMVLMALRLAKPETNWDLEKTFRRALDWQMSFQCRDGGWAAFDKNVTTPWLEDMPFADHNAILDPTCSDLTARTLELLGYIKFNPKVRSVRDAIHYLIETQESDGSWYGRWGVNYIYGTWQVLRGLRAIGYDMTQDWIVRGRDWLESCQNDDGGWGETCATYENAATKGIGKSTASQTAWAIMGICACGDLNRSTIQRGLRFLLSTQKQDGSWNEPEITGTGFPGVFYLKYDMYRQNFPLLALATYVNYSNDQITQPGFYQATK
ncbi:MAG TPA: squalene--hopene cyclase [Chthoniobacterales bacterium]|jgi:squalene-hopene/tetraprenyl-beta-curcumene cyclase|nr:squalene--hopene cyclase [Chthoniobacterales bacterium]